MKFANHTDAGARAGAAGGGRSALVGASSTTSSAAPPRAAVWHTGLWRSYSSARLHSRLGPRGARLGPLGTTPLGGREREEVRRQVQPEAALRSEAQLAHLRYREI